MRHSGAGLSGGASNGQGRSGHRGDPGDRPNCRGETAEVLFTAGGGPHYIIDPFPTGIRTEPPTPNLRAGSPAFGEGHLGGVAAERQPRSDGRLCSPCSRWPDSFSSVEVEGELRQWNLRTATPRGEALHEHPRIWSISHHGERPTKESHPVNTHATTRANSPAPAHFSTGAAGEWPRWRRHHCLVALPPGRSRIGGDGHHVDRILERVERDHDDHRPRGRLHRRRRPRPPPLRR